MAPDQGAQVARAQANDDRAPEELIAAYLDGIRLMREAVADMGPDALRARPIEGRMSALEVLCHVADCEQFIADRMKRTAATDVPLLMGIEATRYLEMLHYHQCDPRLQLELIDVTRRQMAEDLSHLGEEAWARTAVHNETGLVTLRQLLLRAIRHLELHADTIAEKRRALSAA